MNIKGFTLLELVLAITIFTIISAGVAVPVIGNYLSGLENKRYVQTTGVLTESWEALRAIRNNNWADITNGDHGLNSESGNWIFSGTNDITAGVTRVVTISDALRDAEGELVDSGGDPDADTKRVSISLTWNPTPYETRTTEVQGIIANY